MPFNAEEICGTLNFLSFDQPSIWQPISVILLSHFLWQWDRRPRICKSYFNLHTLRATIKWFCGLSCERLTSLSILYVKTLFKFRCMTNKIFLKFNLLYGSNTWPHVSNVLCQVLIINKILKSSAIKNVEDIFTRCLVPLLRFSFPFGGQ